MKQIFVYVAWMAGLSAVAPDSQKKTMSNYFFKMYTQYTQLTYLVILMAEMYIKNPQMI